MTVEQLQAGYNRFTKDYYRMMEIVYRAFKRPNALATINRADRECGAQDELRAWAIRALC